jgi:hypothetical protein
MDNLQPPALGKEQTRTTPHETETVLMLPFYLFSHSTDSVSDQLDIALSNLTGIGKSNILS